MAAWEASVVVHCPAVTVCTSGKRLRIWPGKPLRHSELPVQEPSFVVVIRVLPTWIGTPLGTT